MNSNTTNQTTAKERKHVRIDGAAEYLGVSVPFLRKQKRLGIGPAYSKLGDLLIYRVEDLDRWVESNLIPAGLARIAA